jgi:hypothetical protein
LSGGNARNNTLMCATDIPTDREPWYPVHWYTRCAREFQQFTQPTIMCTFCNRNLTKVPMPGTQCL